LHIWWIYRLRGLLCVWRALWSPEAIRVAWLLKRSRSLRLDRYGGSCSFQSSRALSLPQSPYLSTCNENIAEPIPGTDAFLRRAFCGAEAAPSLARITSTLGKDMKTARARPEDASELTAIAHTSKSHWGYPEDWLRRWEDVLTITPEYILANPTFVAFLDGHIIGFCCLLIRGQEAYLDHLWVLPSAMRKGVGRVLFEIAQGFARTVGAASMMVESDPHAEEFYIRMGARKYGRVAAAMDGRERFLPLLKKTF
jgi:GNAT superfamily N-acetyltransferase